MDDANRPTPHQRWAHLRFCIVGPLLAAPPARGELAAEIQKLALRTWQHPITGKPVHFGASTIERWLYQARQASDPVGVLRRKVRKDLGGQPTLGPQVRQALQTQYAAHPSWSYQLHYDNLRAQPDLGPLASYATLRRYMKASGLLKRRRLTHKDTAGARKAERRLAEREVRSYEVEHPNGLWHLDYHWGSLKVLTPNGQWQTPLLLGILDDHSRLACHVQWYLHETAQTLVHGLSQAIQKRGVPRALITDNGPAETADEVEQGLRRLGILHECTLPYSPYQNGKQESYWGQVEGRLLAMLEGCQDLSLALLNQATQAWVEQEYQRQRHQETGEAPLQRFLSGHQVGRPSPSSEVLRQAFMSQQRRTQRKSDGTISLQGRRFEIPARYRYIDQLTVRYASWDLTLVYLVDERTDTVLGRIFPLDRARNADGQRRALDPASRLALPPPQPGMAPLLRQLMADASNTGLPPPYLPHDELPPPESP